MTREASIVELAQWLQTPPGRYLLDWERGQLDAAVADLFGFHALQLGLPELPALEANRMSHRWLALDSLGQPVEGACVSVRCEFDELPFATASLDLIVLPHALELARDPHQTLREVERVLRPEGRLIVVGLNPASLWGARQNIGRLLSRKRKLFLPRAGDFIGYWRLRDWMRLLGLEVDAARFGCYAPPLSSEKWISRWRWIEAIGSRWWPVLGAVYFISASKRVQGMRLVGLAKTHKTKTRAAPAVAVNSHNKND